MFYRYEIRNYNGKEALYLYLNMNEEVSKELGEKNDIKLEQRVKDYIDEKNIEYDGNDVFLVVGGIVVKNINIQDRDIKIEVLDNDSKYSNNRFYIKVRRNEEDITLTLKEYLVGVMFTSNCYQYPIEVMKAMCVLYRTYAYYKMESDRFIMDNDKFIPYRGIAFYKLLYIENYYDIYRKIERAIDESECLFMTYNDKYILPFIHLVNNGFTDGLDGYPYLERRYSLWDLLSPRYINIREFTYKKIENLIGVNKEEFKNLKIIELTNSNRVKKLKIGAKIYSGEGFRKMLGLSSTDMTILISDNNVKIITRGCGDGLGLSISGSLELSNSGCNFLQILDYYFPKCVIKKYV